MIYVIVHGYNKMPMLFLVGRKQFTQKYNNIITLRVLWMEIKVL